MKSVPYSQFKKIIEQAELRLHLAEESVPLKFDRFSSLQISQELLDQDKEDQKDIERLRLTLASENFLYAAIREYNAAKVIPLGETEHVDGIRWNAMRHAPGSED